MNEIKLRLQELQGQMNTTVQELNSNISAGQDKLQVCHELLPVNLALVSQEACNTSALAMTAMLLPTVSLNVRSMCRCCSI